jgi:hypothetical protein
MAEIAKKHTERLEEFKKNVEEWHDYFKSNIDRYNKFMKFVFKSSLNDDEAATLQDRGLPTIEFNILEPYISRQRGEFAKQQPSISVRASDGMPLSAFTPEFIEQERVLEGHMKAIFASSENGMQQYDVYSDQLGGGFSVIDVYTDYVNPMSFEQNIYIRKAHDPTLCFFDPLAKESHKGDGRFAGELFPKTRQEIEEKWGKSVTKDMKFTRTLAGFNWSFKNEREEIALIACYDEKQTKRETICRLSDGNVALKSDYQKTVDEWIASGALTQPPIIVEERKTNIEQIVRYYFCETGILEVEKTNFKYLPHIFVDGNSVFLKEDGAYTQVTRPFVYHALGIQRLKNLAGQSLGNELENTIQHKFIVALESIPPEYQTAYQNIQKADTVIYKHFLDTRNPEVTLPPPREVMRTPIPPQISDTFRMSDEMTQMILGSFNQQNVDRAPLSGIAFARSAIQGNTTGMPYIVSNIAAFNRAVQLVVDLIPKYYRTPRSLPILQADGKREYVEINNPDKQGSVSMDYNANFMQAEVEIGVNFAMQKEIALNTIVALASSMPNFAQFFSQKGLHTLLDNIDIRGIDDLKEKAIEYEKEQAAMQQHQQQMQQQQLQQQAQQVAMQTQQAQMQSAIQLEQAKKELQSPTTNQIAQIMVEEKAKTDAANTAIKQRDSENKFLEMLAKVQNERLAMELKRSEVDAENSRSAVDAVIKMSQAVSNDNQ